VKDNLCQKKGGLRMPKKYLLWTVLVTAVALTLFLGFGGKSLFAEGDKEAGSVLYVCDCGDNCKCNTVSTKPGKCACGADLVPMHVLKIEKDEAVLCRCGKDCTCKIDPKDPTKCGCGKPVKRVSIKGMYVCNCGPDCKCNTVSDKPGKCKCGGELKKL